MGINKKTFKTIFAVITILFLAICIGGLIVFNNTKQEINQLQSNNNTLENTLFERDSLVNEFVTAFDSIESSLTFINERRSQLVLENNETTPSRKESIVKDIKLMNTMLEESSKEIEELEKKLKSSGFQLKSFKKKIAGLSKNIEEQHQQIVALTMQVEEKNQQLAVVSFQKDSLQKEVLSFIDTIESKEEIITVQDEIINRQINEMHKGFFAYGTIKELTENGVVAKEGGFLGIGKNKVLSGNFNEEYFEKIDITADRSILLNAKKVNFITEHPVNSYKFIEEDGLITRLEIESPEDFWKVSQYSVMEIKF